MTALSVLFFFESERHYRSDSLPILFVLTFLIGIAATLVAAVKWARQGTPGWLVCVGAGVVAFDVVLEWVVPINVQNWTALFLILIPFTLLIAAMLFVSAGVRFLLARRSHISRP